MDDAIEAASSAFVKWSRTSPAQRADYLQRIALGVQENKGLLIDLQMRNSGKLFVEAEIDVDAVIDTFSYYAELIAKEPQWPEEPINVPSFRGEVARESIRVAGLISLWNFPMLTTCWKLAPALAAGCPLQVQVRQGVNLKPGESTK